MCYVNSVAVWTKEKPVLKVETDFPCGYFLMMREPEHTVNQNGKSFYRNYYIYEVLITATYLNCTAAVGPKIEQFFRA